MRPKNYSCPVEAVLGVIGGKWKTGILYQLLPRPLRFGELRRTLPWITEKMLIQQLRELEADGIVHREVFTRVPPKVEYSLTDHGRTLTPALQSLHDWGELHIKHLKGRRTLSNKGKRSVVSPASNDSAS